MKSKFDGIRISIFNCTRRIQTQMQNFTLLYCVQYAIEISNVYLIELYRTYLHYYILCKIFLLIHFWHLIVKRMHPLVYKQVYRTNIYRDVPL